MDLFRSLMISYLKGRSSPRQRAFMPRSGTDSDHRCNVCVQEEERMKKVLLATAAVAGLALASPAFAAHDHHGQENPDGGFQGGGGQGHWQGGGDNNTGGANNTP